VSPVVLLESKKVTEVGLKELDSEDEEGSRSSRVENNGGSDINSNTLEIISSVDSSNTNDNEVTKEDSLKYLSLLQRDRKERKDTVE
jgi:hypothetical protein